MPSLSKDLSPVTLGTFFFCVLLNEKYNKILNNLYYYSKTKHMIPFVYIGNKTNQYIYFFHFR